MLDFKYVLAHPDVVKKAIEDKKAANEFTDVDEFAAIDEQRKKVVLEVEALKAEKNKASKEIGMLMGKLKGAMASGSDDISANMSPIDKLPSVSPVSRAVPCAPPAAPLRSFGAESSMFWLLGVWNSPKPRPARPVKKAIGSRGSPPSG